MPKNNPTRRKFVKVASLGALGLALPNPFVQTKPKEFMVYVGTYTSGKSEGIYLYRLNVATGALSPVSVKEGIKNPSFLALDRPRRHLYAVNEVADFGGKPGGAVGAFAVDGKTGSLTLLNQQPTLGDGPCHVVVDAGGKFVVVANYGGGSVTVFPIGPDGSLGASSDHVQHQGSSVNPARQEKPHAHNVVLDPANRYLFVSDLGLDKVMIYRFDASTGKLTPNQTPWFQTKPGAGPRHFTFHPKGRFAFVINELDSTVTSLAYDPAKGILKEVQTLSTLPKGVTSGNNACADVHVSPDGKFLYGSNRGHDSIVVYAIDGRTGKLTYVENASTQGKTPRNFTIDPTGTLLLAANQATDTVVTFRINQQTGKLTPTGQVAEVPTPVCLQVVPMFG
ncbi:MAG: lactonase family protein [Ferruginibacter sp.]|nr:lactonase family protein [Cytophagales bacterium]